MRKPFKKLRPTSPEKGAIRFSRSYRGRQKNGGRIMTVRTREPIGKKKNLGRVATELSVRGLERERYKKASNKKVILRKNTSEGQGGESVVTEKNMSEEENERRKGKSEGVWGRTGDGVILRIPSDGWVVHAISRGASSVGKSGSNCQKKRSKFKVHPKRGKETTRGRDRNRRG